MSHAGERRLKIAAAQAAPAFLDREATVEKACTLIAAAGEQGAQIVPFPEANAPTYPFWAWEIPPLIAPLGDTG